MPSRGAQRIEAKPMAENEKIIVSSGIKNGITRRSKKGDPERRRGCLLRSAASEDVQDSDICLT